MRYGRLLTLRLAHEYFGDAAPPIAIEPDAPTARLFRHRAMVARTGPGRAEFICAEDRSELPVRKGEPLVLTLRLRATDPSLQALTAALADVRGRVLVIDRKIDAGATVSLDKRNLRSIPDRVEDLKPPLAQEDIWSPPLVVLRLSVAADTSDAEVVVRLAAVKRAWRYNVIGAEDDGIEIRDRAGEISFARQPDRPFANGRAAQVYVSDRPIPARARPEPRFELLGSGQFGRRTLIPVLPSPAPGVGMPATVGSEQRIVSDVYVNLP